LGGTRGAGICSSGFALAVTGSAGAASRAGCSVGRGGSGGGMNTLGGGAGSGGFGASKASRLGAFKSCSTFNSGPGARIIWLAGLGRDDFATIVWLGCFTIARGGRGSAACLGGETSGNFSLNLYQTSFFSCGAISR